MTTCSGCGRPTEAREGCRACVEYAQLTMRAPAVPAARVLLILSAVGDLAFSLITGVWAISLASLMSSLPADTDDVDGAEGPFGVSLDGAWALLVVCLVGLLLLAIAQLRVQAGLERRSRSARAQLTALIVVDLLLLVVALAALGDADGVVLVLFQVAWSGTVLALVWVPEGSRRWFGDLPPLPPPPLAACRGPWPQAPAWTSAVSPPPIDPAYAPYASTPPPGPQPARPSFCPACHQAHRPTEGHCLRCGTRLPVPSSPRLDPA